MTQITYFPDTFKIKDVLKVNNQVFYHIYDGEEYYLYFNYNDEWNRCKVTEDIEVHYINFTYVVFTTDNIFGFKYKYDEKLWVYYESDTLVYIPTSTITQGATTEDYESDNIVTSVFINQYIVESGVYTDTSFLEGKYVEVIFDDKHYHIEWKDEYVYTLVGKVGQLNIRDVDEIVINNNGIYLAYNNKYYLDEDDKQCTRKFDERTSLYYSIDGTVWKAIKIPTAIIDANTTDSNVDYAVCLSEDGSTVWIAYNAFAEMDGNNVVRVYYTTLSIESLNYDILDWQPIDCTIENTYKNIYIDGEYSHGTLNSESEPNYYPNQNFYYYINTVKVGSTLNNKITPIIHSAEDGVCTILLGSDISISQEKIKQTLKTSADSVGNSLLIEDLEKPIDVSETITQTIDEWTFTTKIDDGTDDDDGDGDGDGDGDSSGSTARTITWIYDSSQAYPYWGEGHTGSLVTRITTQEQVTAQFYTYDGYHFDTSNNALNSLTVSGVQYTVNCSTTGMFITLRAQTGSGNVTVRITAYADEDNSGDTGDGTVEPDSIKPLADTTEDVDPDDICQHAAPLLILIKGYTAFSCISPDNLYCVGDEDDDTKSQYIYGIYRSEHGVDEYCSKHGALVNWDTAAQQKTPNNYFAIRYYPSNIDDLDIILLYQYTRYGTLTYAAYFNGEAGFYSSLAYENYGVITYLRAINNVASSLTGYGNNYIFGAHVGKLGCISYDGTFEFDEFYKFQDMKLTSVYTGYSAGTGENVSTTVECAHDSRQIMTWNIEQRLEDLSLNVTDKSMDSYDDYRTWRNAMTTPVFTAVYDTSELTTLRIQNIKEDKYTSKFFRLNHDTEAPYVLTEYYYYRKELYSYFPISDYYCRPIGFVNGYIYYYFTHSATIYSNYGFGPVYINDYNRRDDAKERYNYLLPQFAETFITTTVALENAIYQVNNTDEDDGLLYIPESSKVEVTDYITALVVMSQSLLGVFTAHTAYEYIYGTNDDEDDLTSYLEGYYYLIPTKLQLGNRRDNDVLVGFDGSTIYMPTILGLATLTYEYFVQTTEHVFNYISDNIYNYYKQWDTSPIKLQQFEHWVFMYRQDTPQIYIYDTRSQAWWMWTIPVNPAKIYYQDKTLYLLLDEQLYYLDFDNQSIYDYDGNPIHWKFTSQKLHFGYPTNYKHLTTLTVVTTQQTNSIKYNLKFKNYHNIYDSTTEDTIEYNIETLANCIKKVNFMKTNAIQFELSSDDDRPTPFVTSDIALKYRITEKIR